MYLLTSVLYVANIPRISITPTTISRAAVGTEFLFPYPSHIHGSPGNFPTNRLTVSIAPFQKSCFLCGDIMLNRENRTSISIFTLLNLKEVNRRQRSENVIMFGHVVQRTERQTDTLIAVLRNPLPEVKSHWLGTLCFCVPRASFAR